MKTFFVLFVAMLAMAVSFVSCSNEDKEVITAGGLTGNYKGTAEVSIDMGKDKEPKKVGRYSTTATITTISTGDTPPFASASASTAGASVGATVGSGASVGATVGSGALVGASVASGVGSGVTSGSVAVLS